MAARLLFPLFLFLFPGIRLLEAQSLPYRRVILTEVGETPLAGITCIAEDDRGFLWLGGVSGLFKYDGNALDIFSNRPDDSTSIVPGPYVQIKKSHQTEALWIASNTSGLSFFDLRNERATNYSAEPADSTALISNSIADLCEDPNGGLWVGTNKFTLHYLPPGALSKQFQRFQPDIPDKSVSDRSAAGPLGEIVADRNNPDILWIGSRFGIYRFDKKRRVFTLFPFDHRVEFWYQPVNLELHTDPSGALWCGSTATGLCRLDPHTGQWRIFKKPEESPPLLYANMIKDICTLDEQHLLVLTYAEDAWKINWETQNPEYLRIGVYQPNGRPYGFICAKPTRAGDFWLAYQAGLIHLTKNAGSWGFLSFPYLDPQLKKNNWQRAYAIAPDQQSLYIGTLRGNGLLVYSMKNNQIEAFSYRKPESLETTDVLMSALCFDKNGRCWIGSDTGLLYLDKGARQIQRFVSADPGFDSLRDAQIGALAWQGEHLWIGTKGRGLFRLDARTTQIQRIRDAGLTPASTINCLLADKQGRLWIGHELGLSAIQQQPGKTWHFNHKQRPPRGLTNDQVTCLEIDAAGHLWIATLGGGMLRLRNTDPEQPWFDAYYNNAVPGGNLVYQFVCCDRGQVWLGVQSGLAFLDTTTRAFVNYDIRDGMYAKIGAMIRLPDGRIASGAHQGIQLFHPDSVLHSSAPPVPYLKRFRVFDAEIELPYQIDRMPGITLAYNQNHFSFELGALNFGEKARTSFAYQLEGYDRNWVYSGTRNYISYTNLPAGTYTLRVKAANKHGIWSVQEKTIQIIIRPPYWQTWWFRLGALVLLGAIAYGIFIAWKQRRRTLKTQRTVEYFANADYQKASVRDILWDLSHKCIARLGLEDCVIYLLDESGETLVQEAAYGLKGPEPYHLKDPLHIPLGQGIVGAAALKGLPELVPDTRLDRRYIVDDQARLSELAVPILHDGQVIGVIDSEHSRRGFFTQYHVQTLKTIAALCSDKIASARAEELVQEKERQLRELNRNLAESQLTALRAQMNPHFLFNCLNSINWYIIKNQPADASRYIAKFSRLVRLILEHSRSAQISLTQELEALQLYLDMEAMRFDQRFDYEITLDPALEPDDAMVPPLIFQPYIENAIWHGLMPKKGAGHLQIKIRQDGEHIHCTIEDDGIGRAAAAANSSHHTRKRQSQGLKITEARLRQHNRQENGVSPVQFTDLYDAAGQAAGTRVEVFVKEGIL